MTQTTLTTPQGHSLEGLPPLLLKAIENERLRPRASSHTLTRLYPLFQLACQAIDWVAPSRHDTIEAIVKTLTTDTLCYCPTEPPDLVELETEKWAPIRAWFKKTFYVTLETATVFQAPQHPQETYVRIEHDLVQRSSLELAAIQAACRLTGSCILSLGLAKGTLSAQDLFELSLLEEHFQNFHWGIDESMEKRHQEILRDLQVVENFLALVMAR